MITEYNSDIEVSENSIKNLHNQLLKYSEKDQWHKGEYKQRSNTVVATLPDGTTQTIFDTTKTGFKTEDAMKSLINWYQEDNTTHSLVKCALFVYEFVSIHPFQDGNGRLSRLLTTLLLLKRGYHWIQYMSFEHEIESRKNEYYSELRKCQMLRPNEDVSTWVSFFFNALINIQNQLLRKLESTGIETKLSPREKQILAFISNYPGSKSGTIALKLGIPNPTVKRILKNLTDDNLIQKYGFGPGTNYSIK